MTETQEKVVEAIREVHFSKFPATQTWDIYFTNKRIIFQLRSGGTDEVLFGILGGLITRIFRSSTQKKTEEITTEEILSKDVKTIIIDDTNSSRISVKGKRVTIESAGRKTYKFDMSRKKMNRFKEFLN